MEGQYSRPGRTMFISCFFEWVVLKISLQESYHLICYTTNKINVSAPGLSVV